MSINNLQINKPIKGPGLTKAGVAVLQFLTIFSSLRSSFYLETHMELSLDSLCGSPFLAVPTLAEKELHM